MSASADEGRDMLDALLRAASVMPAPDELPAIWAFYRYYRAGADLLYAVDGARYETPATTFSAAPPPPRWEDAPLHASSYAEAAGDRGVAASGG